MTKVFAAMVLDEFGDLIIGTCANAKEACQASQDRLPGPLWARMQKAGAKVVLVEITVCDPTKVREEPCDECSGTRWPAERHDGHCSLNDL